MREFIILQLINILSNQVFNLNFTLNKNFVEECKDILHEHTIITPICVTNKDESFVLAVTPNKEWMGIQITELDNGSCEVKVQKFITSDEFKEFKSSMVDLLVQKLEDENDGVKATSFDLVFLKSALRESIREAEKKYFSKACLCKQGLESDKALMSYYN